MYSFVFYSPTKIFFGADERKKLPEVIKEYGSKVLLVYSGDYVKESGLYSELEKLFKDNGIAFVPFTDVRPNPSHSDVALGIRKCRMNDCEVIVPVGGGSAIDTAKAIAAGASAGE